MARYALLALGLASVTCLAADRYCGGSRVEAADGGVRLARRWDTVLREDFGTGLGTWTVENFEGKLVIEAGPAVPDAGVCLRVSNRARQGDTAIEVASAPVVFAAGRACRLEFRWRSNRSLSQLSGHKGHYLSELYWLDAAGAAVGQVPFVFGDATAAWQTRRVEAVAPARAASVTVRFGFDSPNLELGESLEITDVSLAVQAEPPTFESSGMLLSRPLRVPGAGLRLAWEADTPAGTAVRVQVACAPDVNGGPGEWSDPLGPKGTRDDAFEQPGDLPAATGGRPWLRYTVALSTADPARTPVLRRVTVGEVTDGPWAGRDTEPPAVVERSPTRTADAAAPIWFRLTDGSGVDPRSLRVALDGIDITGRGTVAGDRWSFTPGTPLGPLPLSDLRGIAGWRVSNYQRALSIACTARRTPGSPPGYHVTRDAGETDTAFGLTSPPIPVVAGAAYRLSYASRHSLDLTNAGSRGNPSAGSLSWLGERDAVVGTPLPLSPGKADPEWHRDTVEVTAPAGALRARVSFGFDYPNLFGGAFVDVAEVDLAGPHPAVPDDRPNLHTVRAQVADFAGNALDRTWYLLIRPPRTQGLVTVRDDGVTLIDGQPFFPIGLYAVWKKPFNHDSFDEALAGLKAAGFNTAHTYSSGRGADFTEFLAAAQRHGLRLFNASNSGANCADIETVLVDVVREEGEPALLAWYLADDTASHIGPAQLRAVADAIHDVDPAHITVQADGVGSPPVSRYTEFVHSTDAFLPELYPIRDTDGGVPQVITDMQTIAADLAAAGTRQKAVWAIVQDFEGWGWPRFPTREELWAMSYLSIIHQVVPAGGELRQGRGHGPADHGQRQARDAVVRRPYADPGRPCGDRRLRALRRARLRVE